MFPPVREHLEGIDGAFGLFEALLQLVLHLDRDQVAEGFENGEGRHPAVEKTDALGRGHQLQGRHVPQRIGLPVRQEDDLAAVSGEPVRDLLGETRVSGIEEKEQKILRRDPTDGIGEVAPGIAAQPDPVAQIVYLVVEKGGQGEGGPVPHDVDVALAPGQ